MELQQVAILSAVLIVYLCIGAAIFRQVESKTEENSRRKIQELIAKFLANNSCMSEGDLYDFITDLRTQAGQYINTISSKEANDTKFAPLWNYAGAFTFSITIVTTIGYGHIYPASGWGRLACVLYALFGIPLTLVVLGGLGDQLIKLQQKLLRCNIRPDAPTINKWLNIIGLVILGIVVMFVIPSTVFTLVEKWDILSSLYYCFITYSTIGFGDLVPGAKEVPGGAIYRICIYLWILVGLAYISLIIKSLSAMFLTKAEEVQKKALERVNLQKLSMITHMTSSADGGSSPENSHAISNTKNVEALQLDTNTSVSLVKISSIE